jgi:hypothetical protein
MRMIGYERDLDIISVMIEGDYVCDLWEKMSKETKSEIENFPTPGKTVPCKI